MKMLYAALVLVIIGLGIFSLKGRSFYVGMGFNWRGPRPSFTFRSAQGWVLVSRGDQGCAQEIQQVICQQPNQSIP
jgi:hypothetical protein